MAEGRCTPVIILVDHRDNRDHIKAMEAFWRERGLKKFHDYSVINRGGALFVEHMQFEQYAEMVQARNELTEGDITPLCGAPWGFLFIGYDGNYYLCCSDWRKQASLGSVFDYSFLQVTRQKLAMVVSGVAIEASMVVRIGTASDAPMMASVHAALVDEGNTTTVPGMR